MEDKKEDSFKDDPKYHESFHPTFEHSENPDPHKIEENSSTNPTDFIGEFLGPIGKWQLRTILIVYLTKIPSSWFMACLIFTAPTPKRGEIFCKPPMNDIENSTEWIRAAHPIKDLRADQEVLIDFCNIKKDALDHVKYYLKKHSELTDKPEDFDLFNLTKPGSSKLIPCSHFVEDPNYNSIITEYDLYCSRDILVSVTQFCHLFGVLSGGIITNYMLKYIEPRQVMLIGIITQIICGNLTGWATTFELHIFFRCLSAACCALMYTAGGVIFTDITSGKYKVMAMCMFEQFWSIGLMLLPAVASYWSSWNYLYMAISFPSVILVGLYPWIPNSPRWLLKRGRIEETKEILLKAARINGKTNFTISELEKQLQIQAKDMANVVEPKYWSIWKGHVKNIVCVHFAWSAYIIVYYGFLLNIRNFGVYYLEENTIICGICEMIGTFIGLFLIMNTELKWLYAAFFNIISSFISLSAWLIPPTVTANQRLFWLMVTSMASKISISTTLSILMTCTTEVVSPEQRRIFAFTSTIWTRIWLLSTPFWGATSIFHQLAPQTVFSCINLVGAFFTSLIDTPRTIKKEEKNKTKKCHGVVLPEIWLSSYKQYN